MSRVCDEDTFGPFICRKLLPKYVKNPSEGTKRKLFKDYITRVKDTNEWGTNLKIAAAERL